jgi:O-antigen/teichoic acid export membrane protein
VAGKTSSHWPITLTNGAVALLSIFLPLALVRILSPEQVGRYNIFFLYVMLCPGLFLTGGLNNGLYHWAGKYPEAKAEVRESWTLLMGITLTVCALGLVCVHWVAPLIKMSPLDLQLILLSIPFSITSSFFEDLMIARGDIWKGSAYSSGFNLLRIASLLAAAWWTRNLESVFWVYLVVTALRALAGCLLVIRGEEIRFIFSLNKTKSVLRYALPVSIAGTASLALRYVDQTVLSFRLSAAKFAFYAMGCLSIPPLEIFEASVNRVLIPRLSRAFAAEENDEAAALFAEGVSELFRFLLPATLGLMLYSEPIIRVLFTQRYMAAAVFLRIYALTYLFYALPFDAIARARADGGWILRTNLFFSILSIAATWFAAHRWNAIGALISVLASQFLMRIYSLTYARRCFAASFSKFLPLKELLMQSGLAFVAVGFSLMFRPLFADARTWFLFTGPLFTLLYFGGTYAISSRRLDANLGPIRVLELTQTLGLGGLERTLYVIADMLNQSWSFHVRVAAYDQSDEDPSLAAQFQKSGIPLTQWRKSQGFSMQSVFRLVRIIVSERIRILHAHDLGPLVYGSLAKICSLGRVRLVLTLHTLLDIQQSARYRLYYKIFLRFPDRIIAVSSGVESGLLTLGVSPDRIAVIPNGVSFPALSTRAVDPLKKVALRNELMPRLPSHLYEARWLLCLARLHPGKGQDIVLDVWQALPPAVRAELVLFFVGQETDLGYGERLRQRISTMPDNDRIVVAGPSEHPQDWIQYADFFISGSLLEGMPLAPLEAAGCGLPTVLSNIEGHRFLKPWADYFNPQKPEEGAQKIIDILGALKSNGEMNYFKNRWSAAAALRQTWDASTMTASYAEAFESA